MEAFLILEQALAAESSRSPERRAEEKKMASTTQDELYQTFLAVSGNRRRRSRMQPVQCLADVIAQIPAK